jgi:hypothetical protein
MTVQEVCKILADFRKSEVAVVKGEEAVPERINLFPTAGTEEFLQGNIDDLIANLADNELTLLGKINSLESNAFLAALQKAHESTARSRIDQWADVYSQKNRVSSDNGALTTQLNNIGIKADDEFVTGVLNVQEEEE